MTTGQWDPDHVRRQVMRQARYALNVAVLNEDRVPPEGPYDVALTNGLLAVIGALDPNAITNKKGFTLAARELLPIAVSLGLDIDLDVLTEGLDLTQPLRHGRADDEWIQLRPKHIDALRALDDLDGLQLLDEIDQHRTVDDLMVALFAQQASTYADRNVTGIKDYLDMAPTETCEECGRETFVPDGYNPDGEVTVGLCIACGWERDPATAEEMNLLAEFQRKWDRD
ncbi:hypothetical protein F9L07_22850 [Pimelobacter simplex]|uniref:Uncharacterized protein n=1 Tax=Nocardioides simplex TaxID=2045 RepID=A0A7J5DTB1_NOCSI|nr:hypothetical protein [Pimelobacter simplex]KAB2808357.1 hypothetical protein F9L07_22850 [Pimelobacter simplex]